MTALAITSFWTWLWSKSTWIMLIQLVNIILASYNTIRTHDLNLKRQQHEAHMKSLNNTMKHQGNRESFEVNLLAVQVMTAALQGITAFHYFWEDEPDPLPGFRPGHPTSKDREGPGPGNSTINNGSPNNPGNSTYYNRAGPNRPSGIAGQLLSIFNSKTKSYISIIEKSARGALEFMKAFSEIGSMIQE